MDMEQHWIKHQIEEIDRVLKRAPDTPRSHDFLADGARYLLENYRGVLAGEYALPE